MDIEKELNNQSMKEYQNTLDAYVIIKAYQNAGLNFIEGDRFKLVKIKETVESVNGHGNRTGELKEVEIDKVLYKNNLYDIKDFSYNILRSN